MEHHKDAPDHQRQTAEQEEQSPAAVPLGMIAGHTHLVTLSFRIAIISANDSSRFVARLWFRTCGRRVT
jgi:hypothetical protein